MPRKLARAFAVCVLAVDSMVADPVLAITRTDATIEFFLQPTNFQNNETWTGVGQIKGPGLGTGALISPCHVLTAAHVFFAGAFPDPRGGVGDKPKEENYSFVLVTGKPTVKKDEQMNEKVEGLKETPFLVAKIDLGPGYRFDKDRKVKDSGHRIVPPTDAADTLARNDIAIIRLKDRVPDKIDNTAIEIYAINQGEVDKENDPNLKTPAVPKANAVKVGFGRPGDGVMGAIEEEVKLKREMFNIIDAFGDGKSTFHLAPNPPNDRAIRNNPPPINTLLYDFDARTREGGQPVNSSNLPKVLNNGASVGSFEGSAASGDSGGPIFQYDKDGKKFIVGVTSSGSDGRSRFGTVGYDTQVQKYKDWIKGIVQDPPNCPGPKPMQDWGDASPTRGYPSTSAANGARHLDFRAEWLGSSRDPDPSVSYELDADDSADEDGVPNLVNQDKFDDGVQLPPTIMPGQSFQVRVRVSASVDVFGFGPDGRYDQTDPTKRLYLNAWADWRANGSWGDAGDKIIGTGSSTGTVAIDPESFGPDSTFNLGEAFQDVGDDGIPGTMDFGEGDEFHQDSEPFIDSAGKRFAHFTFTIVAPLEVPPFPVPARLWRGRGESAEPDFRPAALRRRGTGALR